MSNIVLKARTTANNVLSFDYMPTALESLDSTSVMCGPKVNLLRTINPDTWPLLVF